MNVDRGIACGAMILAAAALVVSLARQAPPAAIPVEQLAPEGPPSAEPVIPSGPVRLDVAAEYTEGRRVTDAPSISWHVPLDIGLEDHIDVTRFDWQDHPGWQNPSMSVTWELHPIRIELVAQDGTVYLCSRTTQVVGMRFVLPGSVSADGEGPYGAPISIHVLLTSGSSYGVFRDAGGNEWNWNYTRPPRSVRVTIAGKYFLEWVRVSER